MFEPVQHDDVVALADRYPPGQHGDLLRLARSIEKRRERQLLELVGTASDVSADSILNLGLEPEANPLLLEAFTLQYPNLDVELLSTYTPEGLAGIANGVKGKYFEVLFRERFNEGRSLGEIVPQPGQYAELAESPTQPGWDVEIHNGDGTLDEVLQLKATTRLSYVKQAFERYPDIRVATTAEIDAAADNILGTSITESELQAETSEQLGELAEDSFTDAVHNTAEWAYDAVPLFTAVFVAVTESRSA